MQNCGLFRQPGEIIVPPGFYPQGNFSTTKKDFGRRFWCSPPGQHDFTFSFLILLQINFHAPPIQIQTRNTGKKNKTRKLKGIFIYKFQGAFFIIYFAI